MMRTNRACGQTGRSADISLMRTIEIWAGAICLAMATSVLAAGPTTAPTVAPAHPKSATSQPATTQPAVVRVAPPDYAGPAIHALAETLRRGEEPEIAAAVREALTNVGGTAVPALAALQKDSPPAIRRQVIEIAAAMSDVHAALPLLINGLKDPEVTIRRTALGLLDSAKIADAPAVAAVAEALSDPDPKMRDEACEYLTDLGEAAAPAVPRLVRCLDCRAIRLLGSIGPGAKSAAPALVAFYQNKSNARQDRVAAIGALTRVFSSEGAAPTTQPIAALPH